MSTHRAMSSKIMLGEQQSIDAGFHSRPSLEGTRAPTSVARVVVKVSRYKALIGLFRRRTNFICAAVIRVSQLLACRAKVCKTQERKEEMQLQRRRRASARAYICSSRQ